MSELYSSQVFDALFSTSPMLAEIAIRPQREGRDGSYQDESGTIRKIDFKLKSVSMEHKIEEARGMTLREFLESARKPGSEMGHLMMRDVFDMVAKTTEKTGNAIDAGGRPFSFDLLIAALDKVELDFGSDGKARFPTLVLNPQAYADVQKKMAEWDKDPSCQSRLEDVIRRKREEFREREARRRLVD